MSLKTHAATLPRRTPTLSTRPTRRRVTIAGAGLALAIAALQLWLAGGAIAALVPVSLLLGLAPRLLPESALPSMSRGELADMGLACALAPLVLSLVS